MPQATTAATTTATATAQTITTQPSGLTRHQATRQTATQAPQAKSAAKASCRHKAPKATAIKVSQPIVPSRPCRGRYRDTAHAKAKKDLERQKQEREQKRRQREKSAQARNWEKNALLLLGDCNDDDYKYHGDPMEDPEAMGRMRIDDEDSDSDDDLERQKQEREQKRRQRENAQAQNWEMLLLGDYNDDDCKYHGDPMEDPEAIGRMQIDDEDSGLDDGYLELQDV